MIGAAIGLVIVVALLGAAYAVSARANDLNEALYQQCIRDEQQDAIIVAQLEGARARVLATLPTGSKVWLEQLQIINDGITALEPPEESPCKPPFEGVRP